MLVVCSANAPNGLEQQKTSLCDALPKFSDLSSPVSTIFLHRRSGEIQVCCHFHQRQRLLKLCEPIAG